MATSTISKEIISVTGTLLDGTEDYLINDAIPHGYKVICGRYYTTSNQYRPLEVGQNGYNLIIVHPIESMANRPYELFLMKA